MVVVGPVKSAFDEVIDVIVVRHRHMSAAVAMCVRRIARDRGRMATRMGLVDRDHVFIDVISVRMMQVAVV
jgi:hypothetical protein